MEETTDAELALTLVRVFGRFRRQLTRLAGRSFEQPGISGAQAEFLRLVGRNPGISVKAAAAELGLVPNSVSTFVTALVQAELLVREPDPQDRRVGRLSLPPAVQRTVDERRQVRHTALGAALAELTPQQRTELERGLAVVSELTDRLHRHEQGSTA
ncbi:MarR family winged helix-turn-helix transcriptional regulator [Nocardia stercoris]|uniref:MarR family transcriptional regulator n=1 Tax=Nocardia stercoris TaxID=2483361 RepID=A0A3M2L1N5_9NOCA|nr:MarR family transcriptional regulator [Nocardia stercoris]RMI31649.1 MarR family transcriptional regulator [Nocardia stercoris]